MNKNIIAAVAVLPLALFSSGCMSLMLAGAPTTQSFEEPPVREIVDAYPKETLFGKWTSTGKIDYFVEGKRVVVTDITDELLLNEDGTCLHTENQSIVENKIGAGFGAGLRRSQETQYLSEGTWTYENGILTMELSRETEGRFGKRTVNFTWVYTINWHSDEEFSLFATDEQFKANAKSSGNGLGFDTRTQAPNGVETLTKKGIPLISPDMKVMTCNTPFKRVSDGE